MPRGRAPAAKTHAPREQDARAKLGPYRQKRDFSKTPEPVSEAAAPAPGLRFVIQKHAARRLHYDLRLELDGVFKSWAVAKGPSLDPADKRLAIHVEDHPIAYGDFEGIIPKGEYGGGTVMIWDRGYWRPDGDPGRSYEKGHLAFELDGEKLKGRWHLVRSRLKSGGKQEQWLFFKSSDEYARPSAGGGIVEEAPDSAATGRTMEEIAENSPAVWTAGGLAQGELLPAGPPARIDPAEVAGAEAAPFPEFVEPCLALVAEKAPDGGTWLHEIKYDGYRLMAMVKCGTARLLTRGGLDWTGRFQSIADAFAKLPAQSLIADGEAVIEDEAGISSFEALQEALADGNATAQAVFQTFDLLYLDGFDLRQVPLTQRKEVLARLLARQPQAYLRYSEHIAGNGAALFEHACRLGLEGIVSKRKDRPYRSGRHGDWLKCKCISRQEFVIGGYVPSTAAGNAIGSLALGYYEDGKLIHAGRTGTGFTQKAAQALYVRLKELRSQHSPFSDTLSAAERRGVVFVEPELTGEVEFRGWTQDGRLRQAAFKGLREDKPASEVRQEMQRGKPAGTETRASAFAEKAGKEQAGTMRAEKADMVEVEGVNLTHPDRILWEGQGLTKLGLAEYYSSVADYILPHIAGRPLALVRCPVGADKQCFFQKHGFAGLPDAVETVRLAGDGQEEALVIRDLSGLIGLVQSSVLEIHPWGARVEDLERPDRLIFDLDPGPNTGWEDVIEAAREVRRRLEDADLESFVKTSGGKGLHVVSPLAPSAGWKQLKAFAHGIASAMEADAPSKYVAVMTKKVREGKIFIDYLRNARGATAVAPYSTRAKPGAPVSAPVRWDELAPEMLPQRFNVANLGRRLARLKSDPWEGFLRLRQTIPGT